MKQAEKKELFDKIRSLIMKQPDMNELCETVNHETGADVMWIDREDLLSDLDKLEQEEAK